MYCLTYKNIRMFYKPLDPCIQFTHVSIRAQKGQESEKMRPALSSEPKFTFHLHSMFILIP